MNNKSQSIRVGLFFLLGLALAWITFESLNGGRLFKKPGYTLVAGFANLKGVEEETLEGFNAIVAVCQTGVWLGMKAAMPALKKTGNGAIVNISSGASSVRGIPNRYVYGASKAAVIHMSKSLAMESWRRRRFA